MTSKKRQYGDLSARPLPSEDPSLIDDVFAAFTGTRPSNAPTAEPEMEEALPKKAAGTPARGAAAAQGAANKYKDLKENNKKGINRLSPEKIQSLTATVAELLGEGQSIEDGRGRVRPHDASCRLGHGAQHGTGAGRRGKG